MDQCGNTFAYPLPVYEPECLNFVLGSPGVYPGVFNNVCLTNPIFNP